MALADELAYATATELASRMRRRELSPVEVVDACIERIQARNDSLNALVYLGLNRVLLDGRPLGNGTHRLVIHRGDRVLPLDQRVCHPDGS